MIITCGNCNTSFNLDEKLLKPSGSKVRCSKCKHLFIAYPPEPPEEEKEIPGEAAAEEVPDKATLEKDETAGLDLQQDKDRKDMAPVSAEMDEGEPSEGLDVELDIDTVGENKDVLDSETPESVGERQEPPEMEEAEVSSEAEEAVSDELEFDLDSDLLSEEEAKPVEKSFEGEAEETSVIDMFGLDETLELKAEKKDSEAEQVPSDELKLDQDFDLEMEPDEFQDVESTEEIESEELDFSDFEETVILDPPPVQDAEKKTDDLLEDLDLDLEMDLEMEEEPEDGNALEMPAMHKAEDVDLEDLDLDLEMDLEMEEAPEDGAAPEMPAIDKAEEVGLEGPDLEMEGAEEVSEAAPEEEAEDIDLSDIEKMLDLEAEEAAETAEASAAGDDVDAEVEKWKQRPIQDGTMDETAEIDLSDIVLDAEEIEEEAEDVELDLDIDEEAHKEAVAASVESDRDASDVDISEFEEFEIPDEAESVEQDFGDGDIELEFELDGEKTPEGVKSFDSGVEPETVAFSGPLIDTEEKSEEKTDKKKVKKIEPAGKSNIAKPILIVLLVLVLAFAAVIALDRIDIKIPVVSDYVKQIPFVNQFMKSEVVQAGEIRITNISSKFVDNEKHGKFFVIRGTATNDFPQGRRYLELTGSLYSAGKMLAQQETVYCGNVISDSNLATMGLEEIKKRLSNRFGDNRANFEVKPGQEIPFMIVFSNLPDDLEEFAIEVAGSSPVQQQ